MPVKTKNHQLEFRLFENEKPATKQFCYILTMTEKGNLLQAVATYIPYMKVTAEDYCDDSLWDECDWDWDNETDIAYTPEGFYEGSTYAETQWRITDKVIAWAPVFNQDEKQEILKSLQQ